MHARPKLGRRAENNRAAGGSGLAEFRTMPARIGSHHSFSHAADGAGCKKDKQWPHGRVFATHWLCSRRIDRCVEQEDEDTVAAAPSF